MRSNARISISVVRPLAYEALSLDPQSFQAIAPSDQTQGFLAAIIPSLKGVTTPSVTSQFFFKVETDSSDVTKVKDNLIALQKQLDSPFPELQSFLSNAQVFYAQIQEAVLPLPRPRTNQNNPKRIAAIPGNTPYPWSSYSDWATLILCELSQAECTDNIAPFTDLMTTGASVQNSLTPSPPATSTTPPEPPPLTFDITKFNAQVAETVKDIDKLKPDDHPEQYLKELNALKQREGLLIKEVPVYAATWLPGVTAVNKDLQTYFVNIKETAGNKPGNVLDLGFIDDPKHISQDAGTATSTKFLGRLVTYSINAINQVSVLTTAVPTTAQKTSVVTISVIYSAPRLEVSTGFLLSWLPNRTFANQTTVNVSAGSIPTTSNIVLTQSIIRPIVLPYAAANIRLGNDFTIRQRRAAIYWTTAIGFNAYNTTAEYAVGPSLSWRMIMLSPLFHIGHDTHLTQGETVNQIWCNTAAPAGSATACVGTPPAPSSKTFWRGAFAFGIGIRVPTSFGTTAGH